MSSQQLAKAYRAFSSDIEVDPEHHWYVPLLGEDPQKDPIQQLFDRIQFEESESLHLLTGFRGNGKSTQLRRLKRLLENDGHTVFLVNLLDWMMERSRFIPDAHLSELAKASGGDIRDFFRLVRECLVGLSTGSKAHTLRSDAGATPCGTKARGGPRVGASAWGRSAFGGAGVGGGAGL